MKSYSLLKAQWKAMQPFTQSSNKVCAGMLLVTIGSCLVLVFLFAYLFIYLFIYFKHLY